MLKNASLLLILFSLVGCASVPMGDPAEDARLKTFPVKPNVAGVYIYRNETLGAAITMPIELDGKNLGRTASKTYFYEEVAPGKHSVTSRGENDDTLTFDAVAGKLYFIWQEIKMGFFQPRTKLHQVGDEEGRKGVLESKLAAKGGKAKAE
ncbi:MAG: DUF2846 domain-containing protein [Gammaproteobacteria bacterium]